MQLIKSIRESTTQIKFAPETIRVTPNTFQMPFSSIAEQHVLVFLNQNDSQTQGPKLKTLIAVEGDAIRCNMIKSDR